MSLNIFCFISCCFLLIKFLAASKNKNFFHALFMQWNKIYKLFPSESCVLLCCVSKHAKKHVLSKACLMFWVWLQHKYILIHSHKKRKDSLEGSLDRVLFAAELEFPKILVPRIPQHTSDVNRSCKHWMCRKVRMVKTTAFFIFDQLL